jgi:hypothetical protein
MQLPQGLATPLHKGAGSQQISSFTGSGLSTSATVGSRGISRRPTRARVAPQMAISVLGAVLQCYPVTVCVCVCVCVCVSYMAISVFGAVYDLGF